METDGRAGRRLRLRCPAVLGELRVVRQRVQRWARGNGLPDGVLVDLQLAVGEAVSNGIEHAYLPGGQGRGVATGVQAGVEVELELSTSGGEPVVAARVTDQGRWRPVPADPGYRGRGLALIRQLSRDMQVLRTAEGTQVTFAIPVAA
ncbi:MAG TPA: ATP-binding protein [Pseudonocardia sp.]|nr:ATP-binding protein [Pseudonocardia sp.]